MTNILKNSLIQTCFGCPSSWDAKTTNNKYIYIRLRHGHIRVESDDKTIYGSSIDGYDGVISEEEMINYIQDTCKDIKFI